MVRTLAGLLSVLGMVAILSGCMDEAGQDTGPLVLYPGEWNGDDAALQGRLVLEASCLYIDDESDPTRPPRRYLPAFSDDGASWDPTEQVVKFPGRTLKVGSVVRVGGSEAGRFSGFSVPPSPECRADGGFWLVGL